MKNLIKLCGVSALMFGLFIITASTSNAQTCVDSTRCGPLGYNKTASSCSGKEMLKCPFGEAYFCVENNEPSFLISGEQKACYDAGYRNISHNGEDQCNEYRRCPFDPSITACTSCKTDMVFDPYPSEHLGKNYASYSNGGGRGVCRCVLPSGWSKEKIDECTRHISYNYYNEKMICGNQKVYNCTKCNVGYTLIQNIACVEHGQASQTQSCLQACSSEVCDPQDEYCTGQEYDNCRMNCIN